MKIRTLLFVILLFLSSCKMDGTNTGNPGLNNQLGQEKTMTFALVNLVCAKITQCFPDADFPSCANQVFGAANYTSELGPDAALFPNMSSLSEAELKKNILVNTGAHEKCSSLIEDLLCDDALVLSSYNPSVPADYISTNLLFRTHFSCQQIFYDVVF